MIAFFDASALIYLIEGAEPFASRARAALEAANREFPDLQAAISRLSWLECRVRPMRQNDDATLAAYDQFFQQPGLTVIELSRDVVELATAIRVCHGLRTPDALQAASCLQLGHEHVFLSGDTGFARVPELRFQLIN